VINYLKVFLAGFIKVLPEKENLKFRNDKSSTQPSCGKILIKKRDVDDGIANSDLHIYLTH